MALHGPGAGTQALPRAVRRQHPEEAQAPHRAQAHPGPATSCPGVQDMGPSPRLAHVRRKPPPLPLPRAGDTVMSWQPGAAAMPQRHLVSGTWPWP